MTKNLLIVTCLFFANVLSAQTITVTNTNDSGTGSLREAIDNAASGSLIVFSNTLAGSTITLTSGELLTVGDVTVDGETNDITVSGGNNFRVFHSNSFNLTLNNLTIINGSANGGSGAYVHAGGALTLNNCTFKNNNSGNGNGGAVYTFSGASHVFNNVSFISNTGGWGGGYYKLFGSVTMQNCLFAGNDCGSGGAMFLRGGIDKLTNVTISGNKASGSGGAFYFYDANLTLENCIVWENAASGVTGTLESFFQINSGSATVSCQASDIQGSGGSGTWVASFGNDLGGNLDVDPTFVNPQSPTSAPTTAGSYELELGSPVQDIGNSALNTTSLDLADHTRIIYGGIDLGAYELCKTMDTLDVVACSEYIAPSGKVLDVTGTHYDTLTNHLGCDSVIVIMLQLQNSYHTISPIACDTYNSPEGNTYNASGTYFDTIPNAASCDSIITINLTINNSTSSTIDTTVCDTYTSPGGTVFNSTGSYSEIITNNAGCDSSITINLTVNNTIYDTINEIACDQYISPGGTTLTTSGTYTDTLIAASGCDSIVTVNLTINNSNTNTISTTACNSYTSPSGNYIWNSTGSYSDTLTNMSGCDSVLTINLTVNESTYDTIFPVACDQYVSPSGMTFTSSTAFSDTISNAAGCDSIIQVNLTIENSSSSSLPVTECTSYSSPSGVYTWTTSGNYTDTLTNSVGCDSVIFIDLTIINPTTATIDPSECYSYTSPSGNYTWNTDGTYTDTISNAVGCDSIITINLSILHSVSVIDESVCGSYMSPSGLFDWDVSGVYVDTIQNSQGCDSIITINLDVTDVDTTISLNGNTLSVNTTADFYQWLNCETGEILLNENGSELTLSESGEYSVIITEGNCIDTTSCKSVLVEKEEPTAFSPNGDGVNDELILNITNYQNTVTIYNRWGDVVKTFVNYNDIDIIWDGTDLLGNVVSGTYYYVIESSDGNEIGWVQVMN